MAIKPVDFQVLVPKTSEISKLHSEEQNKNQMFLKQQAQSNQEKVDASLKKVHSQDKANDAKIRDKQEKNKDQKKKKKQHDSKGEDSKGGSIDIKI